MVGGKLSDRQEEWHTVIFHEFILWLICYFLWKNIWLRRGNNSDNSNLSMDCFSKVHRFGIFERAFWIACSESDNDYCRSTYIRNIGLCIAASCLQNTQTTKANRLRSISNSKKNCVWSGRSSGFANINLKVMFFSFFFFEVCGHLLRKASLRHIRLQFNATTVPLFA